MSTIQLDEEIKRQLRRVGGKTYQDSIEILLVREPTQEEIKQAKSDKAMSDWITHPYAPSISPKPITPSVFD